MDDEQLVRAFEAGHVPPGGFGHAEHVRVGWWYLCRYPLTDALSRFSTALRRLAVAQGKPDLYHETITTAYLLLINERLAATRRGGALRGHIRICWRGARLCWSATIIATRSGPSAHGGHS